MRFLIPIVVFALATSFVGAAAAFFLIRLIFGD